MPFLKLVMPQTHTVPGFKLGPNLPGSFAVHLRRRKEHHARAPAHHQHATKAGERVRRHHLPQSIRIVRETAEKKKKKRKRLSFCGVSCTS